MKFVVRGLLLSAFLIFLMGLLMVFNTSSASLLDSSAKSSLHAPLVRHLSYAFLSLFLIVFVSVLGHQKIFAMTPFLFFMSSVLLALVFFPVLGRSVNGASRWIAIGSYSFQPSEWAKYFIPLHFIFLFRRSNPKGYLAFIKVFSPLSIPLLLIFFEPDNASIAVIGMSLILLLFLTEIPFRYWLFPLVLFSSLGAISLVQLPYVRSRLEIYMDPEKDLLGKGHQPYQARIAAGSGGMWGRGIGKSMQKLHYLPEAQNDYIAAIYAEEMGFVGIVFLISLYASLACFGFAIASRAPTEEARWMAALASFSISIQAFLNLGVVSGLLPSTGLNLPLFSQGGSSLLMNSFLIALLYDIGMSALVKDRRERKKRMARLESI